MRLLAKLLIAFVLVQTSLIARSAQTVTLRTDQRLVLTVPSQVTITSVEPRWQFNSCFDVEFIRAEDGKSVTVNAGLTPCIDVLRLYVTGTVSGVESQIAKNFWVEIVDEKANQVTMTIGAAGPK